MDYKFLIICWCDVYLAKKSFFWLALLLCVLVFVYNKYQVITRTLDWILLKAIFEFFFPSKILDRLLNIYCSQCYYKEAAVVDLYKVSSFIHPPCFILFYKLVLRFLFFLLFDFFGFFLVLSHCYDLFFSRFLDLFSKFSRLIYIFWLIYQPFYWCS